MAYDDQTWTDTPGVTSGGLTATNEVNADRMNHIEAGIKAAADTADSALAATTDTETIDTAAPGSVFYRVCSSGVWPSRGSTRTDILVLWIGVASTDPNPPIGSPDGKQGNDVFLKVTV